MYLQQFFLGGLGHQSYVIGDPVTKAAAVIDPRRDVDLYLQAAHDAGYHITHIFETHVHNDYITGAREIAARVRAQIVTAASAGVAYEHLGVRDGDQVRVGELVFTVLATPGHTPDHLSYAVSEGANLAPVAVFSGGSMLVGSAGRTDLVSPGMTLTLTRAQYHSLQRFLDTFADDVPVYPTHGAGSFCGATMAEAPARMTTIGQERRTSPAALAADEAAFVRQQLAGYNVYPHYYAHMGGINQQGPHILGEVPALVPLAPADIQQFLEHGIPLIDGRPRAAFAHEHIPGSINIELDESFGTYVGWILPFNKPLTLLVEDDFGRTEAAAQLVRIGFDQARGYLAGGIAAWQHAGFPTEHYAALDVDAFYQRWQREELAVLDVRDAREWASGHIPGAQHIHIGDLMHHLNELPLDQPIATICRTGHRAEMAASIIAALGREVIAVQQAGMPEWLARGYPAVAAPGPEPLALAASHAHP